MKKYLSLATLSIILGSIGNIMAASPFTMTATVGGVPSIGGATLESFNGAVPSYLTFSGTASILTGANYGVAYVPPYYSGATAAYFGGSPSVGLDTTKYVRIQNGGSATFNFSASQSYFGLFWGSFDQQNLLSFYDSSNNLIGALGGADIPGVLMNDTGINGSAYVEIFSAVPFSKIVASASANSFEFDDIAYASVVPEPTAGMLFGMGGMALVAFRRSRKAKEN